MTSPDRGVERRGVQVAHAVDGRVVGSDVGILGAVEDCELVEPILRPPLSTSAVGCSAGQSEPCRAGVAFLIASTCRSVGGLFGRLRAGR